MSVKHCVASLLVLIVAAICVSCPQQPPDEDSTRPAATTTEQEPMTPVAEPVKPLYVGKHVLEVDSYNDDYAWTNRLTEAVRQVLEPAGVELQVIRLDAKRHQEEEYIKQAAAEAWATIQEVQPDVVIVSDDIAVQDLVVPYLLGTDTPVVAVGINWDASIYGLPAENVCCQIEIALIDEILALLEKYADGPRLGLLSTDTLTARKNIHYIKEYFGVEFAKEYIAGTYADYQQGFLSLQDEVDMFLIASNVGLPDMDEAEGIRFVTENYRIPSGTWNETFMQHCLVGVLKDPTEVGTWAGTTALTILDGTSPAEIPTSANERGLLQINMNVADKLGVVFDTAVLKEATVIRPVDDLAGGEQANDNP
ncbi:ABC transporter substrate-binding protein [bacterium]|nr:ABC transporter substrate-binding protein [bacterium]